MRISDWSSDVCSSDLGEGAHEEAVCGLPGRGQEAWLPQMLQGVPFRVTWRARLCAVQGNRRVARADRRPDVPRDRKSVGQGKRGSVRVDLGGRRLSTQKNTES